MSDWYPGSRDGQLHLVDTWLSVFQTKATEWGIPPARASALSADRDKAKAVLAVVKSGERTPASVVECNEAFKAMETETRFIKKHYLLMPPLTAADFASLLLPQPDATQTPIPPPTGQPALTITYPGGPHVLMVHLAPLPGTEPPDSRGDYGYALYKGIMPPGGATLEQAAGIKHYLMKAPLSGEELLHHQFTRRKKEMVDFDAAEAGMTAYFCARYENSKGNEGKWGPVVPAIIP
ncbi:MAG: hypothetical protein LBP19_08560 [Treponema sp.]|jgi:hypothetical protein|nr:hypothetical protein [Treponema sp.]